MTSCRPFSAICKVTRCAHGQNQPEYIPDYSGRNT